jgi:hypothetical protein
MSDTLTTLLKGLAEALEPHLPGGDVDDAVQNYVDANFDFEDMVSDAVRDVDFEDILSDAGAITSDTFDASDWGLVSESDYSFDEFVTSEDVRDMVTEELQQTGAVVTRDNILSVLAAALRASDEARAAA